MEIWWALSFLVVSYVITIALTPKVQPPKPEAFEDFDFPQVEDGTPQAVVFGDVWSGDWTVLAVGNYRTQAIKKKSGGKGK